MAEHYTEEGKYGLVNASTEDDPVAEARKRHHLATADPEPERGDGTLTGPAHEEKYGLERAAASAAYWRSVGVHPTENRALHADELETADAPGSENADAPKASRSRSSK